MEEQHIDCKHCTLMPAEMKQYATKTCGLCGELHCDECLNEAGYCTPCTEKNDYSKEEAIGI